MDGPLRRKELPRHHLYTKINLKHGPKHVGSLVAQAAKLSYKVQMAKLERVTLTVRTHIHQRGEVCPRNLFRLQSAMTLMELSLREICRSEISSHQSK